MDLAFKFSKTFQKLVRGTNISEQTLLATDYLNHFNEVIMMLELVPDMPDMLDEARTWQPKTYQQHFEDSAFSDKELAIAAYDHAPGQYRIPFDETTAEINNMVHQGMDEIAGVLESGNPEQVRLSVFQVTEGIQKKMDILSAIVNGDIGGDKSAEDEAATLDQAEIDALFD